MDIFQLIGHRDDVSRFIFVGMLLVIRLVPVTLVTPFLGGKLAPAETRMGLALGLAILSYPYATSFMTSDKIDLNPVVYAALMFKELFVGFAIGYIATELFYAMDIGGRALDTLRGSSMAEAQVPELGIRVSISGEFMFQLLLVIFMALGGQTYFIQSILESFRLVPIDAFPKLSGGFYSWIELFLHQTAGLFSIAFSLVFPGAFAAFLVDIIFGMLNRVSPQLHAYSMAMGVKMLGGLLMFFFAMGMMLDRLTQVAEEMLRYVQRMIELMA